MGAATANTVSTGRVIDRASYDHVTQNAMDRVLAGVQAVQNRHLYKLAGLDIQSQEAYDAACLGLIRPKKLGRTHAVLYNIKCVNWEPPDFEIECHTTNECGRFLGNLIHDIGVELRCGAAFKSIRRLRFGHFDLSHSLVQQQWNTQNIIDNIEACREAEYKSLMNRISQLQRGRSDGKIQPITDRAQRQRLLSDIL